MLQPKKLVCTICIFLTLFARSQDSLPPLIDGKVPADFETLWAGYDPRAEPLDVEILKEWEEEGVVLKVLRYRIGIFKGQKAMMAAVYGYPKGAQKLPALLNIHGGGQYADYRAVLTNARRGYASMTIAWAGRLTAPDYRVTPAEVALFWAHNTSDPGYKVTTDWGALDAYHAPSRNGKDAFVSIPTAEWTLDPVVSPRNNSWFLCTLGARRALTFLEQQPEVDGEKLGVYGHSMGGKLTVLTAGADERVKAAAPSCGGISDRYNDLALHRDTVGDAPSLRHIACPTIFLMPANDFHGHINDLVLATGELGTHPWRVTCTPHFNHKDLPESEVATQLWFDQYLKGSFVWPKTPETHVTLKTSNGVPTVAVLPDTSKPILGVDVFYTQQGEDSGDRSLRENRINRFWHFAQAVPQGDTWMAALPVASTQHPLWVYAHVRYPLDPPVSGAGYYYGDYQARAFTLSSLVRLFPATALQDAGVQATLKPSMLIESFQGDWRKEWFSESSDGWTIKTHKVYHPLWAAPNHARLSLEVQAEQANKLVVGLDGHAAEVVLEGGPEWQVVTLSAADFKDVDDASLPDWSGIKELRLLAAEHLRGSGRGNTQSRLVGAHWKGPPPAFRNLRWVAP